MAIYQQLYLVPWGQSALQQFCTIFVFLVILSGNLQAKQQKWVVLPPTQAEVVARLCSRSALPKVDGSWEPTTADVTAMEKRLSEIPKLQSKAADSGVPVKDPRRYYRQYVGVVVAGRKLIYINAFCESPPSHWQQKLVDDCDGGCNSGAFCTTQQPEKFRDWDKRHRVTVVNRRLHSLTAIGTTYKTA